MNASKFSNDATPRTENRCISIDQKGIIKGTRCAPCKKLFCCNKHLLCHLKSTHGYFVSTPLGSKIRPRLEKYGVTMKSVLYKTSTPNSDENSNQKVDITNPPSLVSTMDETMLYLTPRNNTIFKSVNDLSIDDTFHDCNCTSSFNMKRLWSVVEDDENEVENLKKQKIMHI